MYAPRRSRSPLAALEGQVLVEVLIAISVLTIGFLGVISLLARAVSLNRVVSNNYMATYLAAEGIEIAKNIIDANAETEGWGARVNQGSYELDIRSTAIATPFIAPGNPLYFDPVTKLYSYRGSVRTPFVRKVTITPINDGRVEFQVNSEVNWTSRGGGRSRIVLEDHFYNWK